MKLNQVIAIEKGIKSRVYSTITQVNKTSKKSALFEGFTKQYTPSDEEGQRFPDEKQKVQFQTGAIVKQLAHTLQELFDITAQKDVGNTIAKADLIIDSITLMKDVPATYLLFLEKQLNDIHTLIKDLPILDSNYDWSEDINSGLYKTDAIQTAKTKKVVKPLLLAPATTEHPAQTTTITEDVIIGYWKATKLSGALPLPKRDLLLEKIIRLKQAVKIAREHANGIEIDKIKPGAEILGWLLG